MPINIVDKTKCTGCGACWNSCPKKCIGVVKDEEGFVYPKVDMDVCIQCGLCISRCPILNTNMSQKNKSKIYAGWSKDKDIRFNSTSGGAFSELARIILQSGGEVVGAAYDDSKLVHHIIISTYDELELIRQSKYIQSDINFVYQEVKERLELGTKVLFCGSPCQVAGIKSFLHKEYANLYTIDFICRGMNSPKAYSYWLKEIEDNSGSKVSRVWFKYKENGWKKSPFCTRLDFENGGYHVVSGQDNLFMMGYLKGNLYMRPSCGDCKFKGTDRLSDITLADFWKIDIEYDDDKGTSMIMANTQKGHELIEAAKDRMFLYEKNEDDVKAGNICFDNSVTLNPKGKEFLQRLDEKPFSSLILEYLPHESTFDKWLRRFKKAIKIVIEKAKS